MPRPEHSGLASQERKTVSTLEGVISLSALPTRNRRIYAIDQLNLITCAGALRRISRIPSPIPALMKIDPQESLDFFRIVTDLCSDGGTLAKLSAITSIPLSSLGAYKNGTEPTFSVGLCLLRHWEIKTGKTRDDAPKTRRKMINRVRKH